ncbi:VOC family protein, partial [Phaeobacter sp. HF9A]|uniref:VOC family protein n=1 Tax=Phaeobacter sp. HF9A TaxID=2721561 RepID=UPI0034C5C9C1
LHRNLLVHPAEKILLPHPLKIGGDYLCTDDFTRDHAAMLAAGVEFEEAPRHEPYGTVAVWRDPFGNRWDLLELK